MATKEQPPDGRQLRWSRHNRERREQILDAAIATLEDAGPGAEVHVQEIAARAGLSRTVVYRHFEDRADLDRSVRTEILDRLWGALLPEVTLDGTIPQIAERVVGTYVGWAVAHPALHRFAEQDPAGGSADTEDPLQEGLTRIASQVADLITTAVDLLGLEPTDDERAAVDPLVFGLVGAVFGAVRRWMARPVRTPSVPVFVSLVTESAWHLLEGFGRRLGIQLDPDQPVEDLLASAVGPSA
ncbi:TetR/AcrR family transcriptional regulator [Nocardioides lentus]|uniref:TetR/AcrR family transcriptional regulator n=1 Tax=Nocardioides lentus TaxID=338077 RepID=A0ABP5B2D5_9ACTN